MHTIKEKKVLPHEFSLSPWSFEPITFGPGIKLKSIVNGKPGAEEAVTSEWPEGR